MHDQGKLRLILLGVTSKGHSSIGNCGGIDNPTHYVRVREMLSWIKTYIKKRKLCIIKRKKHKKKVYSFDKIFFLTRYILLMISFEQTKQSFNFFLQGIYPSSERVKGRGFRQLPTSDKSFENISVYANDYIGFDSTNAMIRELKRKWMAYEDKVGKRSTLNKLYFYA